MADGAPPTSTTTAEERYVGILDSELPFDMVLSLGADGVVTGHYAYRAKPEQTLTLRGDVGQDGALRFRETAQPGDVVTGLFSVKPFREEHSKDDVREQHPGEGYVGTWTRADGTGRRSVTLQHDTPAFHLRAGNTDVIVVADVHELGASSGITLPYFLGFPPEVRAKIAAALPMGDAGGAPWSHHAWQKRAKDLQAASVVVDFEPVAALPYLNIETYDSRCENHCSFGKGNIILDVRDGHIVDERELLGVHAKPARRFIDEKMRTRRRGTWESGTALQILREGLRVIPEELESGTMAHLPSMEPQLIPWEELERGVPGFVRPVFQR